MNVLYVYIVTIKLSGNKNYLKIKIFNKYFINVIPINIMVTRMTLLEM